MTAASGLTTAHWPSALPLPPPPAPRRRQPTQVDKPLGAIGAIRIAHRTLWARPLFYVLTVAVVQLALALLTIPLLRLLYSLVLVETGLGSVAYDKIMTVVTNPLADLTLLVLAGVAVIAITCEFITLFVLAAHHQDEENTSFRLVLHQVWDTVRKLFDPQGLLVVIYLLLLLPLGQVGLSSTLTKKVAVPPFVSAELAKSPSSSIWYSAILIVLTYVNFRLILTLPLLATTSAGVWGAFVTSWRLTRWRTLRLVGMLITITAGSLLGAGLLLLASMVPTMLADHYAPAYSTAAATVGLSAWQIGAFVITALLTAMIAQSLIAVERDWMRRLPERHRHDVTDITYSVDSTVTSARTKAIWVAAAAALVVVFVVASFGNFRTLTRLAASDETTILAHRGDVQGGVENTLPALQAAKKAGADRVEFDVLQTKDLKFVVIHDTNLQRLAGLNENVYDLTQAQLMKITVQADGRSAKIPSLEQWIDLSKKLKLPQLLEVKIHGHESPDLLPRLLAVLDAKGVTNWYTYHSLSRSVVEDLKRLRPSLVVGFIMPINFGGIPHVRADFLVVEQQSYDDDFRTAAWGDGYKVIVWTVDDEQALRGYIDDNVNGIISDRVDLAVQERDDIQHEQGLSGRLWDMVARSSAF